MINHDDFREKLYTLIKTKTEEKEYKQNGKTIKKIVPYTKEKFYSDFKDKYGVGRNSSKEWLKNNGNFPDVDNLRCLAEYFNVSTDYLLGLEKDKSSYNDKFIKEETGLDIDAINTLKRVKKLWSIRSLDALNYIMQNTELFLDFLDNLSIYLDNQYTIPITSDNEGQYYPCGYKVAGKYGISFGKEIKDNMGNIGYEQVGVSANILESHCMLQMQKIINDWQKRKHTN